MSTKPVHTIRIGRAVAAIWANETKYGTRHRVSFEHLYYDEQKQRWESITSFGSRELLELAKLADWAHTWVTKAERTERERTEGGQP